MSNASTTNASTFILNKNYRTPSASCSYQNEMQNKNTLHVYAKALRNLTFRTSDIQSIPAYAIVDECLPQCYRRDSDRSSASNLAIVSEHFPKLTQALASCLKTGQEEVIEARYQKAKNLTRGILNQHDESNKKGKAKNVIEKASTNKLPFFKGDKQRMIDYRLKYMSASINSMNELNNIYDIDKKTGSPEEITGTKAMYALVLEAAISQYEGELKDVLFDAKEVWSSKTRKWQPLWDELLNPCKESQKFVDDNPIEQIITTGRNGSKEHPWVGGAF